MALTAPDARGGNGLDAWPGYVDALSTLLMVIIFVLLVFVLAQAFLSVALSGRDQALDRVNRQLAEVSDMLSLERGRGGPAAIDRPAQPRPDRGHGARDSLSQQLAALKEQAERAGAERDTLRAERDQLAQQLADAELQAQSSAARASSCRMTLAAAGQRTDAAKQETAAVATQLADAQAAARRHAAPDRPSSTRPCRPTRTRSQRSSPILRSWRSRTARCRVARRAGEAGAGRGGARHDRRAASCGGGGAACRGEEARRFGARRRSRCSISRWTS